ncbi:hypothetical protein Gpo141_00012082 [Globisporangium polare]
MSTWCIRYFFFLAGLQTFARHQFIVEKRHNIQRTPLGRLVYRASRAAVHPLLVEELDSLKVSTCGRVVRRLCSAALGAMLVEKLGDA